MLTEIIAQRKRTLAEEKKKAAVKKLQPASFKHYSLKAALRQKGISLIAEIKQASPSQGQIRQELEVETVAKIYQESGARAISVLTEPTYFNGSFSHLKIVKAQTKLPVLAKDFVIDAYQIYRAKSEGADAILLMAQVLTKAELDKFVALAHSLEMEVLGEASNEAELQKILATNVDILGINSRDFNTLKIDFPQALKLLETIQDERPVVFESGINSRREVKLLEKKGADGMLVGTSLMASKNIAKKLAVLLGKEEEQ